MANSYLPLVAKSAARYGVPGDLLAALTQTESNFDPNAVSSAGAQGIDQFMPGTWRGSWNPYRSQSPFNPQAAIPAAALYLSRLLRTNHGNASLALAAYNAGQGAVNSAGGIPRIPETQNYVQMVLGRRSRFPGLANGGAAVATPSVTPPAAPGATQPQPTTLETLPNPAYQSTLNLQSLIQSNAENAHIPTLNLPLPAPTLTQPAQAPSTDATVHLSHPAAPTQAAITSGAQAGTVVKLAQQYLGTPYVWGGTTPKGFDCSGFAQFIYAKRGVKLPRTSEEQFKVGQPVGIQQLQPGDLVFFKGTHGAANDVGHEGIYIGGGRFIHAPHTGDVVKISNLSDPYYQQHFAGGRRVA